MARARQLLFRIFYSTSYTFVFFILLAFICASPADTLYQSYRRRRLIDIAIIAGAYVVTGLFAALIYASRIYTNRSIISAIPKTYMPIDEVELPNKRTWRFVSNILIRSAVVALQAKPRSQRVELETPESKERIIAALKPEDSKGPSTTTFEPQWGEIKHRGWSSPAKGDLPNLEYAVVVAELLDLIEAKAVSLAPPARDGQAVPDERLLELLSRPDNAGMRQYMTILMDLGVIPSTSVAIAFLSHYEQARFAPQPLSEDEFQTLMRLFAELLRSMTAVDMSVLGLDDASSSQAADGIEADAVPKYVEPRDRSGSEASTLSHGGSIRRSIQAPARVSEDSVPSQTTDESRPNNMRSSSMVGPPARRSRTDTIRPTSKTNPGTREGSMQISSSSQRPPLRQRSSQASALSQRSSQSSKSSRSGRSIVSTSGSVIVRLVDHDHDHDRADTGNNANALPYTIEIPSNNVINEGARPIK